MLRHIVVGDYRALFTVQGGVVFVLHIRHGRRRSATNEELSSALGELRRQLPEAP